MSAKKSQHCKTRLPFLLASPKNNFNLRRRLSLYTGRLLSGCAMTISLRDCSHISTRDHTADASAQNTKTGSPKAV